MYLKGTVEGTKLIQKHSTHHFVERFFHISIATCGGNLNKYLPREGRFIKKIMHAEIPKKKWYPSQPVKSELYQIKSERVVNPHVTRRTVVLNKIFMSHITDLMANGDISKQLLGRGIEVSRVALTLDFRVARVYWFSSITEKITETAEILNSVAFQIRHDLTQLRVIGMVPQIQFVQDSHAMTTIELEKRFLSADYGEDYQPTIKLAPKHYPILYTKLPNEVRTKIRNVHTEIEEAEEVDADEDDEIYNVNLPPMKHDTLGLDHSKIMRTIQQSLNKCQKGLTSRLGSLATSEIIQVKYNPESIISLRTVDEDQAFADFLKKQKIEKRRKRQEDVQHFSDDSTDSEKEPENDFYERENINQTIEDDLDNFDDIQSSELQ